MRWVSVVALLLVLTGVGLLIHAGSFPIYSDAKAPGRRSLALNDKPRETRSREWYAGLEAYETPHKRLADLGRGSLATGIGILAAGAILFHYRRQAWMRTIAGIIGLWICAWLVRIPLSMWYYYVRYIRFDYPVWGDSIAIPVMQESIAWIAGAVVSSVLVRLLMIRHPLPTQLRLVRPTTIFGWVRAVFLVMWLALLFACVATSIRDGDEGMIFSCLVAGAILVILLSASTVVPDAERRQPISSPAT